MAPQNRLAKLATMLYAAFGVPLLFYTLALTGKQLAQSTLNSLLIIRHYCFSLPVHYLCCACNPYLCFRLLSWCCCCCCCSYLFCPSDNKREKKYHDKNRAPKLRLRRRFGRLSDRETGANQTAYVINVQNEPSTRRGKLMN